MSQRERIKAHVEKRFTALDADGNNVITEDEMVTFYCKSTGCDEHEGRNKAQVCTSIYIRAAFDNFE